MVRKLTKVRLVASLPAESGFFYGKNNNNYWNDFCSPNNSNNYNIGVCSEWSSPSMIPQEFHNKINQALADKYQTTPRLIGAVRGFVIQEEIDFTSYLDFIESKLACLNSLSKKSFYMDLYIFIRKLNDEKWKDITEKIAYRD